MNNRYPALRSLAIITATLSFFACNASSAAEADGLDSNDASLDASDADAFESIVIGADATITFEVGSRSFPPRMTVCTGHEASFVLTPAGHLTTTVCRVVDASDAGDAGEDASPTASMITTESDPTAAQVAAIHAAIASMQPASNPSDYPAYTLTIASPDRGAQRFCAERACTEGRAVFWYSMQQVDRAFSDAGGDDTPF